MKNIFFEMMLSIGFLISVTHLTHAQWVQTNGPLGATVYTFAGNDNAAFAATNDGGVFRSTDSGTSWTPVNSGLLDLEMRALAVQGTTLFAGTKSRGVFRSIDNGANWTEVNNGLKLSPNEWRSIAALTICGNSVFAGTSNGVFVSTDSGENWSENNDFDINSFAVTENGIFAVNFFSGIYFSPDTGKSWVFFSSNLPVIGATYFVSVVGNCNDIFTAIWNRGVFHSIDTGATWTETDSGLDDFMINALAINGSTLFAGTDRGIFRSTDNGTIWTAVNSGLTNTTVLSLFCHKNTIFASTYGGGVFRSTDNGTAWTEGNSGLTGTAIKSMTASGNTLFVGTLYDDVFGSTDNGATWTRFTSLQCRINTFAVCGTRVIAGTNGNGLYTFMDSGSGYVPADSTLAPNAFYSIAVNGNNLFAATGLGFLFSTDKGASWDQINTHLSTTATSVAYRGSDLFLGGTSIYRSTDNGSTWKESGTGLPSGSFINYMAVHDNTLFAATINDGLLRSTDNGTTWIDANTGIANKDISAFADHGAISFIGTGGGIFMSTDRGAQWKAVNASLSDLRVNSLVVNNNGLYAGTAGSGVWHRPLSDMVKIEPRRPQPATMKQAVVSITTPGGYADQEMNISLTLPQADRVAVTIYNLSGRTVASLVDSKLGAGTYFCTWDARHHARGCYSVKIRVGSQVWFRSVAVVR